MHFITIIGGGGGGDEHCTNCGLPTAMNGQLCAGCSDLLQQQQQQQQPGEIFIHLYGI